MPQLSDMSPRALRQTTVSDVVSPQSTGTLREEWTTGTSEALRWRRGVIGLSFAGMAAMGAVALFQTGILRHLPDPPVAGVDSDAASLSDEAFDAGVPDGALAVRSFASTAALAAVGGEDRARDRPAISILAAAKAAAAAFGAAKDVSRMVRGEEPWCPYRLTGAAANVGIFALAVPEAIRAIKEWF